jgi:hypothetical protein
LGQLRPKLEVYLTSNVSNQSKTKTGVCNILPYLGVFVGSRHITFKARNK